MAFRLGSQEEAGRRANLVLLSCRNGTCLRLDSVPPRSATTQDEGENQSLPAGHTNKTMPRAMPMMTKAQLSPSPNVGLAEGGRSAAGSVRQNR